MSTTPLVTIFVRHSTDCKYAGDEFCKRAFGLVPALQSSRPTPSEFLKEGNAGAQRTGGELVPLRRTAVTMPGPTSIDEMGEQVDNQPAAPAATRASARCSILQQPDSNL